VLVLLLLLLLLKVLVLLYHFFAVLGLHCNLAHWRPILRELEAGGNSLVRIEAVDRAKPGVVLPERMHAFLLIQQPGVLGFVKTARVDRLAARITDEKLHVGVVGNVVVAALGATIAVIFFRPLGEDVLACVVESHCLFVNNVVCKVESHSVLDDAVEVPLDLPHEESSLSKPA
jgi:hypothetical protein